MEDGRAVIQTVAKHVQETAHAQIAAIVTKAIQSVFGTDYEFRIEFEKKRGRTEAVLQFLKEGNVENPLLGTAGGLLDVASFALQLVCLVLRRPTLRRLLVLDEPFKHLHRDRAEAVRSLLEELSKELNIQIIMVTHSEALTTGKVIRICSE